MVHDIRLPEPDAELQAFLVGRGRAHFPQAADAVLEKAAAMTVKDRKEAAGRRLRPLPGQAEFIDLVRAVLAAKPESGTPEQLMDRLAPSFFA